MMSCTWRTGGIASCMTSSIGCRRICSWLRGKNWRRRRGSGKLLPLGNSDNLGGGMRKWWVLCAFVMTCCAGAWAQEAPKAGPEQAKLKYFVGDWKSEGEVKPGPVGPGGNFTETVHSEMLGDFFVVIHSDGKFAGMPLMSTSMMSYDPKQSAYIYDEYNSMGE